MLSGMRLPAKGNHPPTAALRTLLVLLLERVSPAGSKTREKSPVSSFLQTSAQNRVGGVVSVSSFARELSCPSSGDRGSQQLLLGHKFNKKKGRRCDTYENCLSLDSPLEVTYSLWLLQLKAVSEQLF